MAADDELDGRVLLELPFGSSRLILRRVGPGMAAVEVVHKGERLVLGYDRFDEIRSNFLSGLDPADPHREMDPGRYTSLLGPRCFYFQGLASTSAIYAAYLPSGVLRLIIQGSQVEPDLEIIVDLASPERTHWGDLVATWRGAHA